MNRERNMTMYTIAVAGILISAMLWQFRLRFPFDDVYISFRYAEHLASGYGLTWNIGGPHTEGYTNFLFILILAGIRVFTTHILAAAQALGLASTVITGILIYNITSRIRSTPIAILATAFYFLTPLTWINALSGMETSVFVMLCVLALFFVTSHRISLAFLASFFATLTRPEGALLAGIIFLILFMRQPFQRKTILSGMTIFIVFIGMYALWKWSYFGYLLPNSFYVKVLESNASSSRLLPGLQYVRLFVTSVLVLIPLTFGIRNWKNSALLISGTWAVLLLIFYLFVLPLEGLYDRFLWPAFAMLAILGSIGINDISERFHRSFLVPAVVAIAVNAALAFISPRTEQSLTAHEDVWDQSMDRIVNVLKMFPNSDSLRFAYGDAGYVVYRTGISHIDLFGLNDTRIAHAKTARERRTIVLQEQPDILLLPVRSTKGVNGYEWVEDAYGIARDTTFETSAMMKAFPYPLAWMINKNSPYYLSCKHIFEMEIKRPGSYLLPAPAIR